MVRLSSGRIYDVFIIIIELTFGNYFSGFGTLFTLSSGIVCSSKFATAPKS